MLGMTQGGFGPGYSFDGRQALKCTGALGIVGSQIGNMFKAVVSSPNLRFGPQVVKRAETALFVWGEQTPTVLEGAEALGALMAFCSVPEFFAALALVGITGDGRSDI